MACPSYKKSRKNVCNEHCFMKKHTPNQENYDIAHKIYGGPVRIQKVIELCTTNTSEATKSILEECKLRLEDPEGGAWKIITELRKQVEELSQKVVAAQGANNLPHIKETRTERVQILHKTLNAVDFEQPELFLLKVQRKAGSQASLNILSGTLHAIGESGRRQQLDGLTIATTAMGSIVLRGWNLYAERHNLVAGDHLWFDRETVGNENFLEIHNQKVAS